MDCRLREEEAGQPVRGGKNWWPGFQGGPTDYVWHEVPPSVEGLVDQYHPHARNDQRIGMYLRVSEPWRAYA